MTLQSVKRSPMSWLRRLLPAGVLCALVAIMFCDVLLAGDKVLLVKRDKYDMWAYFYWVRDWGFDQLRHGNIPLWNPHISCGTPFFGGCQAGLLYPLNWPALLMSTPAGINWSIAAHVLLAGLLMYLWARERGSSRLAGVLAGTLYMFCGSYFFKILAGHPTYVFAGAWVPLVLWSVDRIFATGRVRWAVFGGLGLAMQVLAGSPQSAMYTGMTVALYALFNLIRHRDRWMPVLGGGVIMVLLAALLSAGQVIPLLALTAESIRSDGLGFQVASIGAMQPVAFLTLLCPYLFGHTDYAVLISGIRQLQLNIGAAGLILTLCAMVRVEPRRRRFSLVLIAILLVISLGPYTPVFRFLYDHVGVFRNFRMVSRLGLYANVFMALLAALALDRLRDAALRPRVLAGCGILLGLGMVILALAMERTRFRPGAGVYGTMMKTLDSLSRDRSNWEDEEVAGDLYRNAVTEPGRRLPQGKARLTAQMLVVSAAGFILGGGALLLWRRPRLRVYALTGVAALELFITARVSRATAEMPFQPPEEWRAGSTGVGPEERTFHVRWGTPNHVMGDRAFDANGYEAAVLRRFRQMEVLVTKDSRHNEKITASLLRLPGVCQLMRVRYILADKPPRTIESPRPMGRVELLDRCHVLPGMRQVFDAMNHSGFDPRAEVLLESQPEIQPEPGGAAGTARVSRYESDVMEIVAETPRPALLLITETYSRDWHATPLPGSSQKQYTVMPANLLMRAIPLAAGTHRIRLEYRPPYYLLGLWISGLSALGCLAALGWIWQRRSAPPATSVAGGADRGLGGEPAAP